MVFSLCLVGVLGLMMLYRLLDIGSSFGTGLMVTKICCGLGAVLFALGLIRLFLERSRKEDVRYLVLRGRNIAIVGAVIAVVMALILQFGTQTIKVFYVLLPALAVYYLIYHSYPREFFIVSLDCGAAAGLLWLVRLVLGTTNYGKLAWAAAAGAVVLAAVQAALVLRVRKTGCTGLVDGRRTALFTAPHAYLMMLATCAVMAVLVVLGAVLGQQMAYYLMFAAFAYLFVAAVYYTVKNL